MELRFLSLWSINAPLCSPMHHQGVKHFGDPPDAPEETHVAGWHFAPLHLFGPLHWLVGLQKE